MSRPIDPPIKCGYCGWLIGACQDILQHKCLECYCEESHLLNVDDNFVVTLITRAEPNTEADDDTNIRDEKLIQAMFARPALYNIKLPVQERTKLKKDALWQEVTHVLGGTLSTEAIKKRWQYLRDCFIKTRNKVLKYKPSGSAAEVVTNGTQSFRFYQQMNFLCDSLPSVPTRSNIESPVISTDSACAGSLSNSDVRYSVVSSGPSSTASVSSAGSLTSPLPQTQTPKQRTKKRKLSDDQDADLEFALVTALKQEVPQPDAVDGFLTRLGAGLRRIPYRERSQLEIKILTMLMETENNQNLYE